MQGRAAIGVVSGAIQGKEGGFIARRTEAAGATHAVVGHGERGGERGKLEIHWHSRQGPRSLKLVWGCGGRCGVVSGWDGMGWDESRGWAPPPLRPPCLGGSVSRWGGVGGWAVGGYVQDKWYTGPKPFVWAWSVRCAWAWSVECLVLQRVGGKAGRELGTEALAGAGVVQCSAVRIAATAAAAAAARSGVERRGRGVCRERVVGQGCKYGIGQPLGRLEAAKEDRKQQRQPRHRHRATRAREATRSGSFRGQRCTALHCTALHWH